MKWQAKAVCHALYCVWLFSVKESVDCPIVSSLSLFPSSQQLKAASDSPLCTLRKGCCLRKYWPGRGLYVRTCPRRTATCVLHYDHLQRPVRRGIKQGRQDLCPSGRTTNRRCSLAAPSEQPTWQLLPICADRRRATFGNCENGDGKLNERDVQSHLPHASGKRRW